MRLNIQLGREYVPDLLKRLKRAGISHKALCREIRPPMDPAQFSRWANKHISPDVNSIIKIESAIARIEKRKAHE